MGQSWYTDLKLLRIVCLFWSLTLNFVLPVKENTVCNPRSDMAAKNRQQGRWVTITVLFSSHISGLKNMELSKSNTAYSLVFSSKICLIWVLFKMPCSIRIFGIKSPTQGSNTYTLANSQGKYGLGTKFSHHHSSSLTTSKPCNLRRLMPVTFFPKIF